jgi:hypothetical protein
MLAQFASDVIIGNALSFGEVSQREQIGEGAGVSQIVLLRAFGDEAHFVYVRRMNLDAGFLKKGRKGVTASCM